MAQATLSATDDPNPLWVQAAAVIRQRISDQTLPAGRRLPAERDLCQQLGVSRVTLRKALQQLVEEGVLSSSHGRGWYVSKAPSGPEWPNTLESFTETARRKGLEPSSTVLTAEVVPASFDEAEEFGIVAGTDIFRLVRVRHLDGVAIGIDDSRVPLALAEGIEDVDFVGASLLSELAAHGVEPVHADSIIEARGCTAELAAPLDLAPGDPVLAMRQVLEDQSGRTVLVTSITYRGDRYRLHTSFARVAGPRS
ncbi:GntR family transcriptional regulator [Sanguibacter sp. 4.1]|uniref:GntR family transcriptional regulator n=1 Tax=Sanguibacter biliveldensis TaxID=3030830 RepID=A0AAF0Z3B1_9MICO|nr:GntR family transcriptional regulator [Sanguibacter sp. 4.1]WPF82238.1 GntR family transcriptional regulator [Sanguibacter sp. 4.1]